MKTLERRLAKLEGLIPSDTDVTRLSETELRSRIEELEAKFIQDERDRASASGEDVSRLDEMDFYIRFLRRADVEHPDLRWGESLSKLVKQEIPDVPRIHYQPCNCTSCLSGETHPQKYKQFLSARRQAWLHRYMPGEALQ